jgi:hypothetical protein
MQRYGQGMWRAADQIGLKFLTSPGHRPVINAIYELLAKPGKLVMRLTDWELLNHIGEVLRSAKPRHLSVIAILNCLQEGTLMTKCIEISLPIRRICLLALVRYRAAQTRGPTTLEHFGAVAIKCSSCGLDSRSALEGGLFLRSTDIASVLSPFVGREGQNARPDCQMMSPTVPCGVISIECFTK